VPKDLPSLDSQALAARFRAVRERSVALAAELSAEDLCVQTMPDVSPGKWHLAHVTWFWETFLLKAVQPDYQAFDTRFNFLFNSYYEAVGARHARPERGFLTRPSLDEVLAYRRHVDACVLSWLETASEAALEDQLTVLRTGFAHEEQHQELFLTDIKHVLSCNSYPEAAFARALPDAPRLEARRPAPDWVAFEGGLEVFGTQGEGFAFDNEGPVHKAWLEPFALAKRPVSNGEYFAFMEDGGYQRAEFWLSDGWAMIQQERRRAPLYWRAPDDTCANEWRLFTLHGLAAIDPDAPVCHLDYYEASAFAAWAGARLPEEHEWELAARLATPEQGRWADPAGVLHSVAGAPTGDVVDLFGEVWEWTRSAYSAYPGFETADGAIGEYNGKFMCGQYVLRGGSCLSPPDHVRDTYRNFFPPHAQWQMTGVRLARDL